MAKDTKYFILLTLLYFTVSFIGILHHELWLDEAHHWLLARDSNSIPELLQNTQFEGHPLLWSLLLYGITRFTTDPFWMQFLHILIATTSVIVFLKKAPFDWLFKTLFIFGYFMIFEYNLVSRNYSLGVLFLFLACTVFKNREQKFSLLCLYLAIATNTHLMFAFIVVALFLTLLMEHIQHRQFFKTKFLTGYALISFGLFFIAIQMYYTNSDWLLNPISKLPLQERLVGGFGSFFKGIVAIPDFRIIHFWNSNLIVNWSKPIAGTLAVLIYLMPLLLFFKNWKTLFFIYSGLIGTQIFFFITQRTATRFCGMTFILVIIALWIEHYYESEDNKLKSFLHSIKLTSFRKPIIFSILLIQFCGGIYAYSMDYVYPFSSAKETIGYLDKKNKNKTEIITVTCDGTLLSAYLEKKIYFLCNQNLQSFCRWNSGCSEEISQSKVIVMLTDYMNSNKSNTVFFVSYYPLTSLEDNDDWVDLNKNIKVKFVKKFDQNIVEKTNYYIFEVVKSKN